MHQTANGQLPLCIGPSITYSALQTVCDREYAERGPDIVGQIIQTIECLESAEDNDLEWFICLSDLNDFSIELGAMNPLWADFSVVCFMEFMDATRRSPESRICAIKSAFQSTVVICEQQNAA